MQGRLGPTSGLRGNSTEIPLEASPTWRLRSAVELPFPDLPDLGGDLRARFRRFERPETPRGQPPSTRPGEARERHRGSRPTGSQDRLSTRTRACAPRRSGARIPEMREAPERLGPPNEIQVLRPGDPLASLCRPPVNRTPPGRQRDMSHPRVACVLLGRGEQAAQNRWLYDSMSTTGEEERKFDRRSLRAAGVACVPVRCRIRNPAIKE
jgi:hypothetical protein